MKQMCGQLVLEVVDEAMRRIAMRPSPEVVAKEVHEWRASRLTALMGIARHLADAVMKVGSVVVQWHRRHKDRTALGGRSHKGGNGGNAMAQGPWGSCGTWRTQS